MINALVAQVNKYQGEWTDRRLLYTNAVDYQSLWPDEAETTIATLLDAGYVEHRDGGFVRHGGFLDDTDDVADVRDDVFACCLIADRSTSVLMDPSQYTSMAAGLPPGSSTARSWMTLCCRSRLRSVVYTRRLGCYRKF